MSVIYSPSGVMFIQTKPTAITCCDIIEQTSNELVPSRFRQNAQRFTAASDLRKLGKMLFVCCCSLFEKLVTVSATLHKSKKHGSVNIGVHAFSTDQGYVLSSATSPKLNACH